MLSLSLILPILFSPPYAFAAAMIFTPPYDTLFSPPHIAIISPDAAIIFA
jgi:hypothetical protein